jgi:branched-chain amino acid transport system ATP-binding protein
LASPETALELRGITAAYGKREVLRGLELSVAAGEVLAVLGHNGAGKTTALRVVAGLKSPSAGSVHLMSKDVGGLGASKRALTGLALVPEGVSGIFPSLTVRQNLDAIERRRTNGDRAGWSQVETRLHEAFSDVLVDRVDQLAGSMSGGQRQMLAISLALLRRPTVLLLDEPSTGLAPIIVERIFEVIDDLVKATGTAVLLVEQDITHALKIATRVVVVRSGAIIAEFSHDECPSSTELWRLF